MTEDELHLARQILRRCSPVDWERCVYCRHRVVTTRVAMKDEIEPHAEDCLWRRATVAFG